MIISVSDIPKELWSDRMLRLPDRLSNSYGQLLDQYNVKTEALDIDDPHTQILGGRSKEETLLSQEDMALVRVEWRV